MSATFESLWQNCFGADYLTKSNMTVIGLIFFALLLGATLIAFLKHRHKKDYKLLLFSTLPLLALVIMDIQFHLMDSKYLVDRRAIILYPSIILAFAVWLELRAFKLHYWIAALLTTFSIGHWIKTSNLESVKEWAYDAHNKQVIAYVEQKAIERKQDIQLGAFWLFQGSLYFHATTMQQAAHIQTPIWEPEVPKDAKYDYFYIPKGESQKLDTAVYQIDKIFGQNYLYKKKKLNFTQL
jgi:hypothetical protein